MRLPSSSIDETKSLVQSDIRTFAFITSKFEQSLTISDSHATARGSNQPFKPARRV
jgi:hypothetical protein